MNRNGVLEASLFRPLAKVLVQDEVQFCLYDHPDSKIQNNSLISGEKIQNMTISYFFKKRWSSFHF